MTTYCASCGAGTQYELDKPEACSKCHKPFAAAFKVERLDTKPGVSMPKPAAKAAFKPRRPVKEVEDDESDEDYDMGDKEAMKAEILASLMGSGGIRVRKVKRATTLNELINNPDAIDEFEGPAVSKPAPDDE